MSFGDIVGLFGKVLPLVEHLIQQGGPLIDAEEKDLAALWAAAVKAFTDLKIAFQAVQATIPPAPPSPEPPAGSPQ